MPRVSVDEIPSPFPFPPPFSGDKMRVDLNPPFTGRGVARNSFLFLPEDNRRLLFFLCGDVLRFPRLHRHLPRPRAKKPLPHRQQMGVPPFFSGCCLPFSTDRFFSQHSFPQNGVFFQTRIFLNIARVAFIYTPAFHSPKNVAAHPLSKDLFFPRLKRGLLKCWLATPLFLYGNDIGIRPLRFPFFRPARITLFLFFRGTLGPIGGRFPSQGLLFLFKGTKLFFLRNVEAFFFFPFLCLEVPFGHLAVFLFLRSPKTLGSLLGEGSSGEYSLRALFLFREKTLGRPMRADGLIPSLLGRRGALLLPYSVNRSDASFFFSYGDKIRGAT